MLVTNPHGILVTAYKTLLLDELETIRIPVIEIKDNFEKFEKFGVRRCEMTHIMSYIMTLDPIGALEVFPPLP